uniref:DUF3332 family protein n=1 Tax=Thaumasiovibrio occultus TaxID=1891184 RepID=UPI000B355A8A|nr:DUF3332 family protein [Thaumasiovibrio occultus]
MAVKKSLLKTLGVVALPLILSGCVGSNALTGKLMGVNIKAVDNRYARGGLNMLMSPLYGFTVGADYMVFNSIEFWTGSNIITGQKHIFDTKTGTWIQINGQLDPALHDAPIPPMR